MLGLLTKSRGCAGLDGVDSIYQGNPSLCPKGHLERSPCRMAMGCRTYGDPLHVGLEEHPFATYFDVHQGFPGF